MNSEHVSPNTFLATLVNTLPRSGKAPMGEDLYRSQIFQIWPSVVHESEQVTARLSPQTLLPEKQAAAPDTPEASPDFDSVARVIWETPVLQEKFMQIGAVHTARKKSIRRKEQNRQAQRAFRERKEKYINDLERRLAIVTKELARVRTAYDELRTSSGQEGILSEVCSPDFGCQKPSDAYLSPSGSSEGDIDSFLMFDIDEPGEDGSWN